MLKLLSVLKQLGLEPITLKSKEGLALLNGTQFMSAYGVWCLLKSNKLNALADFIGAISLDGFDGRSEPFKDNIHIIRPHKGQLQTARAIRENLNGSEILAQTKRFKCKTHILSVVFRKCMALPKMLRPM
jgi:histidine ammonia-lyase